MQKNDITHKRNDAGRGGTRRWGLAAGATLLAAAALAAWRPSASAPPTEWKRTLAHSAPAPTHVMRVPIQVTFTGAKAMPPRMPVVPTQVKVTEPPFTLTASLSRAVPEGHPVVLALALHNSGTDRLIIDGSAFEQSSFGIRITNGAGRAVARTTLGDRVLTPPMVVFANATVILDPGQTLPYRFNLARLFDLSRAGDYVVRVSRSLRPQVLGRVPGRTPQRPVVLALPPLNVRMVYNADAVSGPTTFTPPPGRQPFLYMVSQYEPGIGRYRVGTDGSVSFASDPAAPAPGAPAPAPALGSGPGALFATPNGRFLYVGKSSDNTVSQFRVGADGVLLPLSPPTFHPPKPLGGLLMDPKGRFLYDLPGARYTIGADGRLIATAMTPSDVGANDREHTIVPGKTVMDSTGTFLYSCNGLTYGYRLGPEGRVTALPTPTSGAAGPSGGRDNVIALSPSGKFAFVGVSQENATSGFDLVVPMRVAHDGTLTPIPGGARKPQAPPLP